METLIGLGICAGFTWIGYMLGHGKGYDQGLEEQGKLGAFWEEVGRRVK